ncbi:hypothetical protein K461DRAFT_296246 [Myriangium duriaei CBS 260.36]|uniref:SAM domain-containing protein n=1 Tax=Myriangium duriaei CBS 260.36 TaxID=1168546 RepID=A0A9P4IWH4_9PEZI|nr:hypothetical protein K461DRAFT_296246 [Myriangium duriaei CBS 260.36]
MSQRLTVPSSRPSSRPKGLGKDRPKSQLSEQYFTEFEDDDSESEQNSLKSSSNGSFDSRRRSDTTVSSYGEVATPQTENETFEILIKPVEGPQGPHLFRASQSSAEFAFDFALQMSPLDLQGKRAATSVHPTQPKTAQHRPRQRSLPAIYPNIPGLPQNLHDWSSDDVVDWMSNTGTEDTIIRCFRENDITGTVLVDMRFENLKDLGIHSFGKRHQIWSSISDLKGGNSAPSPAPVSAQDTARLSPRPLQSPEWDETHSLCSDTSIEDFEPVSPPTRSPSSHKKKRKHRRPHAYQPLDFVDCVGIEYTLPKEHKCSKGQACKSWQRWYKKTQRAIKFNEELNECIPRPASQQGLVDYPKVPAQLANYNTPPVSEGIPSMIASSDVLGPGQLPAFALHEAMLQRLDQRDPQENVKQFLHFQNVPEPEDPHPSEEYQAFDETHYEMFPSLYHQPPCAPLRHPNNATAPDTRLKHLPRLAIPRANTASPSMTQRSGSVRSPTSAVTAGRSVMFSPMRYNSPASEMDIPVTLPPIGPITRDFSQSVPPNMQFRDQYTSSRPASRSDRRRPSLTLPALTEDKVLSPIRRPSTRTTLHRRTDSDESSSTDIDKPLTTQDLYGEACKKAGYMRKRKTRMLWHEWSEAHFRLHGAQLAMHADQRVSSKRIDQINVNEYTVNCSSAAGNGKLSAAMKALRIKTDGLEKKAAPGAFAFQLVPERIGGKGKTHHFAVQGMDERLDWVRELMLVEAKKKNLQQRGL